MSRAARLSRMLLGLMVLTVSFTAGCAGLSARVDREALLGVPNEELLLLFDAENAVYIARDEEDLASRNLQDAKVALERARAYRDVIDQRRKGGATIDSVQILDLLGAWNDARIAMREAEVTLRETELSTSDVRLWAARARYEHEKARLVKDLNPSVGADLEMSDFEQQVAEWDQKRTEADARVAERKEAVVAARATYYDLSRRLQAESNGAYGGPWADLLD